MFRRSLTGFALVGFVSFWLSACGGDSSRRGSGTDGGAGDGGGTSCPAGEGYFVPGCGSGEEVTITAGCYRPCTGAEDDSCPAGTTCRRTDINPCVCPVGEGCCAACGAEQWLCLEGGGGGTDPYELASLDESCEDILTGRDVLDAIEDVYTAAFEYHDETPSTELTLAVAYEDGRLVCHPAVPAPPGSGAPDQPAYLEVEVTVGISTADGAFDESAAIMLTSYVTDAPVQLRARFDVAALSGTYEPQLTEVSSNHGVTFGGQLMGPTTSGNAVEAGTRSSGVGETMGIGAWSTD